MRDPYTILKEAIKAVPSLKYALGVLGIVSVLVIIKLFQINPAVAWFGVIGVVVLMVLLLVFAAAATLKSEILRLPAIILIWSFLFISIASGAFLFSCAFFSWPQPLDQFIKRLTSGDPVSISTIPEKDFPKVIQLQKQMLIKHFLGTPEIEEGMTFQNPYAGNLTLSHLTVTFTGPDGKSFSLYPQGVVMGQQVLPPVDGAVLSPHQSVSYDLMFNLYSVELTMLLTDAANELNQKPPLMAIPDPSSQNLSAALVEKMTAFMNRQFKWKAGDWQFTVTATYGEGNTIRRDAKFSLNDQDIVNMRAISKYYASGIGVIIAFRFVQVIDECPYVLVNLTPAS